MKRIASGALALMMTLLLLLPAAALAEDFNNDVEAMNLAAKSVYKLESYANGKLFASGSGFVAYDEHIMVTNYHVIENADQMKAISDDGEESTIAQVLWADQKYDFALLVFPAGGTPLAVSDTDPVRGGRCVAIGSPQGRKNTFSEGMISGSYEPEENVTYIQFNAPVTHGSSGGALFNNLGQVIGITQGGYSSTDNANLNYAVDIRDVTKAYNEHRSNAPIAIADAYTIADSSFKDDYHPGEELNARDLKIVVPAGFDVYTYSGTLYMKKGDYRLTISALDTDDLGLLSTGVGLLGMFMNVNDLALETFAGMEFDSVFDDSDLLHPSVKSGVETAMIRPFMTTYKGADNNVSMAMIHEDSTFLQVIISCPSGTLDEMSQVMTEALNCIYPAD